MGSKYILSMVAIVSKPENEAKYNKWYNEVHTPMLFKYKGMKKATRFQRLGPDEQYPKYLSLYEFESMEALAGYPKSPEFAAAMKEMQETWKPGELEAKWRVQYEPIKTWER